MPEVITDNLGLWSSALLTKSTAGRGSNGKLEAYGIKKLRELILELAVRGKLVPQDASDEPAGALLEKIAREKARLIKEGVIKNEKPLPSVSKEEVPFNVPGGWIWQRLGELGYTQTGGTPSKSDKEYFGNDIPFIKPGDIYPNYVDYDNEGLSNEGAKTLGRTAPAGSILMVCIGTIGKCNMIERTCAFNQQINSITPYMEMSGYLLNALSSVYFQKTAWEKSSSTTIAILNKGKWVDIAVPIPPLEEQHRIVAKVDELMALCDQLEQQQTHSIAAHQALVEILLGTLTRVETQQEFSAAWARIVSHFDTLFITEASIDQLKQTILQLAVMGKLVPQDPNDEPASVLMRQCVERKPSLIEQGKVRAEKPLPEIKNDEKEWELPGGWVWERLGNIFSGGSGTTPLRSNANYFINGTENWFKTTDLNLAIVMEGEEKVTKQAVEECNLTYYPPKTVCIAMYGGAGTIGKSGVLGVESTINQSVFALPPVEQILPEYLHIFVKTARDKWMQYAAGLRKDPNINGLIIKKMVMPVPPKEEQHRIVAKVDELLALCDTLKARLADAQAIQLHLADAIVEQAVC